MREFIYANDLCSQHTSFNEVEATGGEALDELTHDYRANSVRAIPDITQVTAFHLRNKEAKQSGSIVTWRTLLTLNNYVSPWDRTLSYKEHTQNTKIKMVTRNNLLRKLTNCKWGTNASTIRTTALALCYSVIEYAAPV